MPNLTLRRCPVCQNSSGLYSEQFRNSLTLTQNGCETTGGRGCTHGDDICTSSARYGFIFGVAVLCCFRFCLDCIAAVMRIGGKYQQHICFYAVHLLTCLVCSPFIHPSFLPRIQTAGIGSRQAATLDVYSISINNYPDRVLQLYRGPVRPQFFLNTFFVTNYFTLNTVTVNQCVCILVAKNLSTTSDEKFQLRALGVQILWGKRGKKRKLDLRIYIFIYIFLKCINLSCIFFLEEGRVHFSPCVKHGRLHMWLLPYRNFPAGSVISVCLSFPLFSFN